MSIQAMAWAIEQPVPGEAKLVLISLANHADHTTGHCSFEPPTIAREASITEAALPRYVGALRRNGYLAREEKGKEREYWLKFDREAREWAWSASGDGDGAEPDVGPAVAPVAPPAAPVSFKPTKQAEARKAVVDEAEKPTRVFVIEGSRAWDAWCDERQRQGKVRTPPISSIVVDGRPRKGWWFPSLFPQGRAPAQDQDQIETA